MVLSFYYLYI